MIEIAVHLTGLINSIFYGNFSGRLYGISLMYKRRKK